ncbi:MAG: hypothetical protein ACI4PC_01740 [Oscillospiraceae bacterium]
MEFLQALSQHPMMMVGFLLLALFLTFWIVVSVAIVVSPKARETFSSFLPQWFGRNGRPFTKREKIGACFQLIALGLILFFILQ